MEDISQQQPMPTDPALEKMTSRGAAYGQDGEDQGKVPAKMKRAIVDHFNGLIDKAHGAIASTMPDDLKTQLIDVSDAEKSLSVKSVAKTLNKKIEDLPQYTRTFNQQLGSLKKDIAEVAQHGKISVGDLHEIVSEFQKTDIEDVDKPHMGEIKGGIASYLLDQADQQTGGLLSQSYQQAMQIMQKQGQQQEGPPISMPEGPISPPQQ